MIAIVCQRVTVEVKNDALSIRQHEVLCDIPLQHDGIAGIGGADGVGKRLIACAVDFSGVSGLGNVNAESVADA